ncbi:MAG: DNA gyrase inhibitor YacG [Burkholderiaceae bacterium]|nr:DNA gyrase inhibitor YacG [Burkholderiaceae bacterium]
MRSERLTVKCPGCGRGAAYASTNPWRPFFSERCRQHDLGGWASEQFRISTRSASTDNSAEIGADAGPNQPERRLA